MDNAKSDTTSPQIRLAAGLVLWGCVGVQTFEIISRHFRPTPMVVSWVMFLSLAAAFTMPARWPRMLKAPILLLAVAAAGYNLYLVRVDLRTLLWVLLSATLPIAVWLVLRRWTSWLWVKNRWALFGLLTASTAIVLGFVVMLNR